MSGTQVLAATVAYLLPVVLVALLLTAEARRPRWLLTTVLLVLPLFYVGHYLLLQTMTGWPSESPLPQHFHLLAFKITEPGGNGKQDGEITLWIDGTNRDQPRAHRLAYDKNLHHELVAAGQRQALGHPQLGTLAQRPIPTTSGSTPGARQHITFSDVAGPSLPLKQ